ncbi:MAG TPA: hypothetical protein VFB00_01180 [Terriglobales bacterium]|nr:hypothetical protein [Terriglobales bacterium]
MKATVLPCLFLAVLSLLAGAQLDRKTPSNGKVAVVDGGAGPCSMDLTVNGPDGKPVYGVSVKVHFAYGFAGLRKLDLEAGTNSEGKVKFTGLPDRVRRPPAQFQASKDDLVATLDYDPRTECEGKHAITLEKPKASEPH